MSIRRLLAVAAAAPLAILWLATPAAAHVLVQPDPVGSYTLTSGRLWSLVAAGLGLAGVVAGGLALARARRRIGDGGRRGAVVALVTGLAGAVIGGMVVAAAKGGPGTGYGIVGGYLALLIGIVALTLAALTLRSRRGTA